MFNRSAALLNLACTLFLLPAALRAQSIASNAPAGEELLRRAAVQLQAGELKAAEDLLRKVIVRAPDDVRALSLLGTALGMQGRLEESCRFFEKALGFDPGNADLSRNLAANQLRLGRASDAKKNLEMVLKSQPGDRQAILMLGFACEKTREFRRAVEYLEQVPELVQQQPDAVAALVRSYYNSGQKERARARLSQLQGPSAKPASVFLGARMAMEAKDWETAERLLSSIQSTDSSPALVDYQLARVRYETRRYDECKALLEPIANSPESNGSVINLLAWCYLKGGDAETATKIFSYAVDKFPSEAASSIDLGKLYLKENRLDIGLKVVQRGAAQHPASGPLFELKGELESRQGLHAPAVQSYQRAVRLNPQSPEALLGLAVAQTNLLQNREAMASYEKGLKLFPRDARFYAEYGKTLLLPWASGEVAGAAVRAERVLKKAIQLDGAVAMPRFELGNLLAKNQRAEEALPHLIEAARLDAGNPQVHFVLARAYRALGRAEDAERETLLFQKLSAGVR